MPLNLPKCLVLLCRKHFTPRVNIPFKKVWYPLFLLSLNIKKEEDTVIIIYDRNVLTFEKQFLQYLRNRYPNLKLIYLFSNIARISGASDHNMLHELKERFDMVFAFDEMDAKFYGFNYNPLIYTARLPSKSSLKEESDLFYIGLAKDRLPVLLEIYEKAKKLGLKCDFNIVDVPEKEQLFKDEINYNRPMKYNDVLEHIKHTKCLVDVIQGNSTGYTIKTAEAIVLGKKLITTNANIAKEEFYTKSRILIYPKMDITKDFVMLPNEDVPDCHKEFFSPKRLIKQINQSKK